MKDIRTAREQEMVKAALEAGITSPREIANFMAQISHESGNLTKIHEGFVYSKGPNSIPVKSAHRHGEQALHDAWSKAMHGQPQGLANLMYGGRMGNNESGDGWKYRGRGYVQLTGRDQYESVGRALNIDLVKGPELAARPDIAAKVAVKYWKDNGHINTRAREDVDIAGQIVNGGTNGRQERQKEFDRWVGILTPESSPGCCVTARSNPSTGLCSARTAL